MSALWDRLTVVAACLCEQITAADLPEPCFCGVVPGDIVDTSYVAGNCSTRCGMAYVRVASTYPATGVGVLDSRVGNCTKGTGMDVELGILRCISVGDTSGNPPTPEQLLAAADLQLADAVVLRRTVECCDAIPTRDSVVGAYVPFGPQGGIVGGTMLVQMMVDG